MEKKFRTSSYYIFLMALLMQVSTISYGQTFGKNKVQYKNFDWMYIQSDHFDIYFAQGGKDIAEFTAFAAESALVSIQKTLQYRITNRIPIIVFNSHNDFQQNNVIGTYLEEGIGGVTELLKNRITIPFEGSYKLFRHVIHHELVHAVINDMFYGGSIQSIISNNIRLQLPNWINEGFAEYESLGGWDNNSDMFIRDATVGNYLPPIPYLSGYFAYRGGQSLWWYISEKYGKQKVGEILNHIRNSRSIEGGFRAAIGLDIEELSERWQKEMKVIYWPDVAKRKSPQDFAKRLTNHRKLNNFYNTSPAISPSGDKIAFISDRSGYFSIYIMSATDGENVKQLIEGQQSSDFEELHLLTPGITWSPDGKKIAMSVKAGASDAIFIIDVETGDREKLPIDADGIFSVEWSSKGDKIAFVGNNSKQSDIYVFDLKSKELTNLTNDLFTDAQPSWSPDDQIIYFTSDRGSKVDPQNYPANLKMINHNYSQMDIYAIDVETKAMARITKTSDADESYPIIVDGGKRMLFISDKNGINNIYVHEFSTGKEYPITNSISGVYQLSISRDGNKLAFASMDEAGFDIFLMKSPLDKPAIDSLEETEFIKRHHLEETYTLKLLQRRDSLANRTIISGDSTSIYGENIQIDFSPSNSSQDSIPNSNPQQRITFAQNQQPLKQRTVFAPTNNLDQNGDFKVNKYKLSFSPDLIYGNAQYNTFYGVLGTTQIAFSDMLGDHQIYFLTNLMTDIKNSDFALAYFYLPNRVDWSFQGYHSARFLYSSDGSLYRFRNYGFGVTALMPFDKFNRIDLGLSWMNISRENLDIPEPFQQSSLIVPSISYVHDNSRWGMLAPVMGSRYELTLYGSPGLGGGALSFGTFTFDYRKYYSLGSDFSYVLRGSGGGSFGGNAQRFFIGGTENWINRTFENGRIPINNANDFAFLTPGLPLRGFNYNARIATRYALFNTELRFPLVKYFLGGVLPYLLQTLNSVIFIDAGAAWDDFKSLRPFIKDDSGNTIANDLLMGTGFGVRLFFLGFPLKLDVAWAYNVQGFSEPKYYISLGGDF